MDIKAFLLELRDLGVTFSVQNGKLRSQSAKGALTPDMQTRIRDNKDAIIAFLSNTFGLETERAPLVRVSRDQPLPLSHAQHRLWFLDQLEPGNPFYNIPNAMRLCGNLDIDALQSALDEIVRRHETLRTHFALVDGQAVQIIGNAFKIALPLVDLTTLSAQQREDEARQLADAEARVPFDLASGPLLRAKLLRVAADEHILLYTLHHIVSDGWSMGVLFRELAALYQAHLLGQASPLPELTIQYADFAQWQREWLTGAVLQQQGNYWQKQLANAPALLALPTDRPRPVVQGYAGATHDFTINAETGTALNTLARDTQSSLFMVLAAAFNVLLQRYSGQHDICLGTPIANRNRDEVEPLIGFFVNSLVLRTDLEGNPSFKALLLQVRQTTLDAYAHQDLPFDQVVELLKPERSTSHAPLFQVMLALQNAPMDALDLPGLTLKPATASTATAKLDLRLAVFEHAGTLMCSVEYKTDLFDSATIERLGRHFTCLLAAIAADPACPINALPLHTPAERAATIAAWDQLQPGFSQISDNNLLLPLAANNVLDLFEQTAQQTPVHPAVEYDGRQLGYRELDQLANRIAASLAAQGCQSGQIVGLLLQDPLAHLIAMLGVLKAGAIFVSLSPSYPLQRLRDMVDVATPQWLISQQAHDELRQQLHADGESPGCLLLDQYGSAIIDDATIPAWSRTPVAADAPCYIYFTSGSTGKPKAVLGQTRSLAHFIQWEIGEFNLNTNSRISQLTIPTFDVYLRDVFAALCAGGTICIPPTDTVLDAAALLGWLEQSRITLMHSVPTLFRTLLDSGRLDADCLPALQHVLLAGEMLLPADANRWIKLFGERAGLVNLYGPTETTLARFFHRLPSTPVDTSYIPVGQPIAGAQAILLDEQQAPCFAGQIGEIHIRTPYRSLGYYGNDDATQAAFIPNPLSPHAGDVLYRTGDLGCITADGQFRVLGRKDFQIKVRGMRIEPGEIETVLASLLEVRSAIVTALEDEHGSKRLVAYVIATIGGLNAQTLSVKLAERLPDYMVPQHIVLLDRLPLTANGKVDRKALPKPDLHNAARTHIAPRTASEAAVAAVWAEVLKLDRVGAEDDFFAAGGHSLLATQVMSKLRAGFNIELPLRALFEAPTVATLAARIDDAVASRRDAALPPLFAQLRHPGQEHAFPLSFSQQRLWFLDQFERSAVYNIPFAIRLHGALNTNALKAALNGVIARHEGLRTTFVSRDEQAVQIIAPQLELDIEQADLKALDEAQRPQESNALLEAHSRINFDLGRGPLLRALLISLGEQEHILAITLHHIVTDGWATGILVSELAALYTAALSGEPAVLAPLSLQYADFAHWQRQAFSSAALEAQLAYWKAQLAGAPAMLTLPTDRQRPVVQTYNGSMAHFTIPAATTAGLLALSQQYRATLFMTLLAAFNLLLARYSGQHDLCVGTPIANRNRTEVEPLIGIFINTLVLRARVDPQAAFTTLLEQVRETTLGAYEHQDTPFEHLVELLRPERQTSYSPLFQVMLVMQNNPRSVLSFSGLTLETVQIERATSKFDLTLNVMEDGEVLQALFEYNTDLFDETTIARMAGHYATLLDGIVATPTARCADLPWLTAVEQQQLLLDWNATAVAHASPPAFHHLFEQQVDAQPAAPALLLGDAVLSYAELDVRANQLAHALRTAGVGPDVCVGVCLSRSFELVIALLAILKAGGAYVPLDPAYPPQRLAHMLADASPRLVLAEQAHADVLRAYAGPVWLLDEAKRQDELAGLASTRLNLPVWPQQLAYVIYTSGSTGLPKGTLVPQAGLVNLALAQIAAFGVQAGQRVLQFASFNFDAATSELCMALGAGATLVLARAEDLQPGPALQTTLQQQAIHVVTLPPVVLPWLDAATLPQLHSLVVAGEACPAALANTWQQGRRFCNAYGPTETTVCATLAQIDDVQQHAPAIGRPIANTRVYLLDAHLQPVPVGVAGELYIAGIGLARGYLNRPDLSAERFLPDPYGPAGSRMYRSGDLARWLPDGHIDYLGRSDQQVKLRGFRIELGEIEATLLQQPAIRDAVVVARQDDEDTRLVAYLVAQPEQAMPDGDALRSILLRSLPDYMVPAHFVVLEQLPLTPNGKVDRQALPAPQRQVDEDRYVAPRTATEARLAAIWAGVLKLERVGIHDNFFALGGHSLLATRLVSHIRQQLGWDVPLRNLFSHPSVAALAATLVDLAIDQAPPIVPVSRQQALPLSFAQQRLWFLDQFDSGSAVYNLPLVLQMQGVLDQPALQAALNDLLVRHEALRTRFISIDNTAVQHIEPVLQLALPLTDLSDLPAGEREAHMLWLAQDEVRQPFDLATGPLLRAQVLRLAQDRHVLLLTLHHIVADGWSMGILLNELTASYRARLAGEAPTLPVLPIQYADFAHWQRQWLSGDVLARQLDYWQQQLADAPAQLGLPFDRPRPAVQTFNGAKYPLWIPADTLTGLQQLGRDGDGTLFMTLSAAFALLLARYSGQSDLCIGTPIANRNRAEIEGLIGFFVNTLVLRAQVDQRQSFAALLQQLRATTLAAYEHQDLPFEQLVDALKLTRDTSYSPLFQVMIALQNNPRGELSLPGLTLEPLMLERDVAKYDLTLGLVEHEDRVLALFEYNTDLFDEASIARMAAHFQRLLQQVVASPHAPLATLDMLSASERQQLLTDWNDTARSYPATATLPQLFEAQVRQSPDHTALVFEGKQLSYAQLNARANQLARWLQLRGTGPESRVALCFERSLDMVVSILAVLKAGAAYVPLDPAYPRERLAYMLADATPTILLTHGSVDVLRDWGGGIVCDLGQCSDELISLPSDNLQATIYPDNIAYVIYTSGSTGRPKGVQSTHHAVVNIALSHREQIHQRHGKAKLNTSFNVPYAFDASLSELVLLLDGHTLHIVPEEVRLSPEAFGAFLVEHRLDALDTTPAQLRYLLEHGQADALPAIVVFGGEAIDAALWQQLRKLPGRHFYNAYGPTECTVDVTLAPLADSEHPVIGRPEANTRLYVLDAAFNPVPVGVSGELYIAGAGLARGYLNQPALTAERFVPDPFNPQAGARMYRSGDAVRYLPNGQLEYLGRIDEQVKIRGFRIETGEIEAALHSHPAVAEALVQAVNVAGHQALAAYVVRTAHWQPPQLDANATGKVAEFDSGNAPFSRAWRVEVAGERIAAVCPSQALVMHDAAQRSYRVHSLASMPYGRADFDALHADAWPAYFAGSPVLHAYWEEMYRCFPHTQMLIKEAVAETVGVGNAVPLHWDGSATSLPRGWDGALTQAIHEQRCSIAPNTLVVLAGIIDPVYKARKLAGLIVDGFKLLARSLGLQHVLVALRPIAKTAHQDVPLADYATMHGSDGRLLDNWLRLHCDAGGSVIATEAHSQRVEGSIAQWQEWTGQRFADSGTHYLPDTLAPVHVSLETDYAFYDDPCIWVEHPLAMIEAAAQADIQTLLAAYRQLDNEVIDRILLLDPAAFSAGVDASPALNADNLVGALAALAPVGSKLPATGALRDHLARVLPAYMIPAHFVFLDRMPLTATGKVDRKALPLPEQSSDTAGGYVAPASAEEHALCDIWQNVLGITRVGVTDNFFEIGGDSILSIRVISRAKQAGLVFSAKQLFAHQTIRTLLPHAKTASKVVAPQEATSGVMPLLPIHADFFAEHSPAPAHFNQSAVLRAPADFSLPALRAIVTALYQRHDALRLRYTCSDEQWRAEFQPLDEAMMAATPGYLDLRGLDEAQRQHALAEHGRSIQTSLDLASGPLWRAVWCQADGDRSRLLLVLHHLVVDGVSWRILRKDIEQAWGQYRQGKTVRLESKGSSYAQWAHFLHEYARSKALQRERSHWLETMQQPADTLPASQPAGDDTMADTQSVLLELDAVHTQALLTRCHQAYGTQINDLLLAALMLGLRDWAGIRQQRILLEGHGREELSENIDLNETVGWFTTAYPVWLALPADNDIGAAIRMVKEQLRTVPAKGTGYGVLRHLAGDAEFTRAEAPRIIFNYLGQYAATPTDAPADFSQIAEFAGETISALHPRSHLLGLNGGVREGCLSMALDYSAQRHADEGITALRDAISHQLHAIIAHCQARHDSGAPISDFAFRELVSGRAPLMTNGHDFLKRLDLNHWNASDLLEISAEFTAAIVQRALQQTLEQHDAMRVIFVEDGGQWQQYFQLPSAMAPWWEQTDLTHLPDDAARKEIETICAARQQSLDIRSVLFRAVYFHLGQGRKPRLLLVIHHAIVDRFGGEIFVEDLEQACISLAAGREPAFPPKSTSMKALAEIWQERAQHPDVLADLAWWRAHQWQRFKPLPQETRPDKLLQHEGHAMLASAGDALSSDETMALLSVVEHFPGLSIGDVVTCAVVFAYGNWTGSRALMLLGGQNGRAVDFDDSVDLTRTVGWCMHYTRTPIDLCDCTDTLDALYSTQRQLAALKERAAHYALLRYMNDDANIRAQMADIGDAQLEFGFVPLHVTSTQDIQIGHFSVAQEDRGPNEGPMRPGFRPFGGSAVRDGRLGVGWTYCRSMFAEETMNGFITDVLACMRDISQDMHEIVAQRAASAALPSTAPSKA